MLQNEKKCLWIKWSQPDIAQVTCLFYKLWKSQQIECKKRVRACVRILHVHILLHVKKLTSPLTNIDNVYKQSKSDKSVIWHIHVLWDVAIFFC